MKVKKILSIIPKFNKITILNQQGVCVERGVAISISTYFDRELILASFCNDSVILWVR